MSGLDAFSLVRMAVKSVALSVVYSWPAILPLPAVTAFLNSSGHALAVGRAVVDDGDGLALEGVHRIAAQRATQVHVVSHDAEGGLVALAGELGVGGRRADLRDAGVAVDLGRGDGGARVQVTHHGR